MAAAGNPNITDQLLKGVKLGDREYKNHLDGYNQMDLLTGKGPSKRHELFYFGGPKLGRCSRSMTSSSSSSSSRRAGPGRRSRPTCPRMVNIRQDPFERTPIDRAAKACNDLAHSATERLLRPRVLAVRAGPASVAKLAMTAIDYPPMQDPASFNLDAVKKKVDAMIREHRGQ